MEKKVVFKNNIQGVFVLGLLCLALSACDAGSQLLSKVLNTQKGDTQNALSLIRYVQVGATVSLSGQKVAAKDFMWTLDQKPSGSAAALTSRSAQTASFIADKAGSYVVQLALGGKQVASVLTINAFPAKGYSKLDAKGVPLTDDAVAWSCVRDNVTGLIWEIKSQGEGLHSVQQQFTNHERSPDFNTPEMDSLTNSEGFKTAVNAEGLCGQTNWRLPEREELRALLQADKQPAIDTRYFPDVNLDGRCGNSSCFGLFWAATPYSGDAVNAWQVNFADTSNGLDVRGARAALRLVSSGS